MYRLNSLVNWRKISLKQEEKPLRTMCIEVCDASDKSLISEINEMERNLTIGVVSTHIQIASHQERAACEFVKSKEHTTFAKVFWDERLKEIRIHAKTSHDLETMKFFLSNRLSLNLQSSIRDNQAQTKHNQPDQHPFHYAIKIHERLHVHIYSSDILEAKTEVIVNAANEFLEHAAGVAGFIAAKAGKALTDESYHIASRNKLKVTDVVPTTSGMLPHKAVLHAIGPRWKDYTKKKDCLEDLRKTITNILHMAEKFYFRSVAIPSISAGTVIISI